MAAVSHLSWLLAKGGRGVKGRGGQGGGWEKIGWGPGGEEVDRRNNGYGHTHVYSMTRIFSVSNFKAKTFLLLLHSRRSLKKLMFC